MPLLERIKLYQDVWSRPCTKIAAELGISSSALKRICTEMDILAEIFIGVVYRAIASGRE